MLGFGESAAALFQPQSGGALAPAARVSARVRPHTATAAAAFTKAAAATSKVSGVVTQQRQTLKKSAFDLAQEKTARKAADARVRP